jgi:LysM repeat protein
MKGLKVLVLIAIACSLVFSIGCAARQTVKQEAVATPETQAVVAEATAVPTAVPAEKYVVKKGDTLWAISAKGSIYKDNFQWPLLFKANRDAIEDPDLIQVNQELVVKKDFAKDEVTDAVQKAKDTPPYKPHTAPRKKLPLRY